VLSAARCVGLLPAARHAWLLQGGPWRGAWLAWEAVRARRRSPVRLQMTRDARVRSCVGPRRCAWCGWARVGCSELVECRGLLYSRLALACSAAVGRGAASMWRVFCANELAWDAPPAEAAPGPAPARLRVAAL
jgi:hypothetical protein